MTATETLPRATVNEHSPELPCCGRDANEQPFCHTLGIPHLLRCVCGAVWEAVGADETADGRVVVLEARREAACRETYVGRVWWQEEGS